ncbi:MAG: HAMP domain-containing protein [Clostridium sp.]
MEKDENVVYSLFIDKDLKAAPHSDTERIGITLDDEGSQKVVLEGQPYASTYFYEKENVNVYDVLVPVKKGNEVIGAIDIGVSLKNIELAIRNVVFIISGISILAFVLISLILTLISNSVINPLKKLVTSSQDAARGELYNDIQCSGKDEVGDLALSFKDMVLNLKEAISNKQCICFYG